MTDEALGAIEARLQAATPGPWRWDRDESDDEDCGGFRGPDGRLLCYFGRSEQYYRTQGEEPHDQDRALIAHAPTDLAALVAEVRRWRTWARENEAHINGACTIASIHGAPYQGKPWPK